MEFVDVNFKNASCRIYKFGATITDWKVGDKKIIFTSPKAVFDGKKAIRGGVPVCFPSFGPWTHGPQHGFARITNWQVVEEPSQSETGSSVTFRLTDSEETLKSWNYKFTLDYKITLESDKLKLDFDLKNTGEEEFSFTTALHTYFNVDHIEACRVVGLNGLRYLDKTLPDIPTHTETRDEVSISSWTDRVYLGPAPPVTLKGVPGGSLNLTSNNLPDVVVWNPWKEKAAAMADLGEEAYPGFICVEAGQCVDPIAIAAGASWHASHVMHYTMQ